MSNAFLGRPAVVEKLNLLPTNAFGDIGDNFSMSACTEKRESAHPLLTLICHYCHFP